MNAELQISWERACRKLGLIPNADLSRQLIEAWSEPHRHYHNLKHLSECIKAFKPVQQLAKYPGEVEIALWFHDAIYALQAKDNERRSADWAKDALSRLGLAKDSLHRVDALIMATCHQAVPTDADQQLLVDIDLSILGASAERFAQYDQQIRLEYAWVPDEVYWQKRQQVLKGFLARPRIYSTEHFFNAREAQARENLTKATSIHPRIGVGVIVMRDGKVLLGERIGSHGAGSWALPGGHLDYGEGIEACAAREVLEETGLVLSDMSLGPYTNDFIAEADGMRHYLTCFVIANALPGELQQMEPHKCKQWVWLDWETLKTGDKPLFQPLKTLLDSGFRDPNVKATQ